MALLCTMYSISVNLFDIQIIWFFKKTRILTIWKKFTSTLPFFLIMLKLLQHKSTKSWNFWVGLFPPLMTKIMSGVKTNGVRSRLILPTICLSPKNFPKSMWNKCPLCLTIILSLWRSPMPVKHVFISQWARKF